MSLLAVAAYLNFFTHHVIVDLRWVIAAGFLIALSTWRHPDQADGWHLVHAGKFGSWALLISLSFVLVAAVKAKEGTLYGRGLPRVTRRRLRIAET